MVSVVQYGGKIIDNLDIRLFQIYTEEWRTGKTYEVYTYNPSDPIKGTVMWTITYSAGILIQYNHCLFQSRKWNLLLRTSDTTAHPQGVPLTKVYLVTNGAIIARRMQLTQSDVCYSVIPLFHISGICAMVSGDSVCCDGQPFDSSRMEDALALSIPQPT